jgi:hypothetical protein
MGWVAQCQPEGWLHLARVAEDRQALQAAKSGHTSSYTCSAFDCECCTHQVQVVSAEKSHRSAACNNCSAANPLGHRKLPHTLPQPCHRNTHPTITVFGDVVILHP